MIAKEDFRHRSDAIERENAICREAIESAVEFVKACIEDDDSDSTQGAGRATLRRLAEAVGKACPKLLYEKREGQKLYGLRYRELARENEQLKITLQRWIEWARMNGNAEHAHGLIVDSVNATPTTSKAPSHPPAPTAERVSVRSDALLAVPSLGLLEAMSGAAVTVVRTPAGVCVLSHGDAVRLARNILNSISDNVQAQRPEPKGEVNRKPEANGGDVDEGSPAAPCSAF